jgi:hypothetical protein
LSAKVQFGRSAKNSVRHPKLDEIGPTLD